MASRFRYSTYFRKQLLIVLLAVFTCFNTSFAQNDIADENKLAGNPSSEWDISGAGDLSIQGFATDISANKGQVIRFKINTDAPSYTITIYRLGYYQGNGARLITSLGSFPGTVQPTPNTNTTTGLVECSNWSESATWAVPATAVSGVYIAKLTRSDNNGSSHIVFIVRDDTGNADILFKTSDATWQAYNAYGGNSLYVGATSFTNGHAVKVSYDRPFITRNGGGGGGAMEDWFMNAEYPMIRFLERNGYDMSYTTDVDMDRSAAAITPAVHRVLLSVGHDEYWSAAERIKFENARNAGVHLAFFSGNEAYWKTRWEDNNRTLVCYKEGTLGENVCNGECDPSPEWTGLWRDGCGAADGAGGCDPENILTGQIGWMKSDNPITVPDTYKNLRFWRFTSVAALGDGLTETLPENTIGYEWDYEQFPASYPSGRIILSSTEIADKTHKLSLYRHSSGALVFGAGTVQWSWGLDDKHDRGNAAPSLAMQQATVNLFADMGVQPGSLMAALVASGASTDNTAPVSVITSPDHGTSLPMNIPVTISGTASDAGGGVVAGVEISFDGGATWQVATGTTDWNYTWIPLNAGTVSIKVRGFDDSGNMGVPGSEGSPDHIEINITTAIPPGTYTIFQPTDVPAVPLLPNSMGINLGVKFRTTQTGTIEGIRYYKGLGATGTHTGQLWTSGGTLLAEAVFVDETASGWQEVLFTTPVIIFANTTYIASYYSPSGDYCTTNDFFSSDAVINGPLRALAEGEDGPNGVFRESGAPNFPNSSYQSSNYWVDVMFTPDTSPDGTAPLISSVSPVNNASAIAINTPVSAIFDEDISPVTVSGSTFELRDASNIIVPATVTYVAGARMIRLTPFSPLNYNTTYTVTIIGGEPGIKDLAGNPLAADLSWSFTTVSSAPIAPGEGHGGPVLVISSTANPFSRYPVEILRAEGLNHFAAADISTVNASLLNNYDVVILGEMTVNAAQVTLLTDWVNAGGTLIAFKPGALLTPLLGLSSATGTLSDKYLLVNTASGPGAGIVNQTIQFHGEANLHTLNGAVSLADLYSDAVTATANPAVTSINVGTNGGKAIAFTYDLAKSIIYTRQGNPAWAGQERDGQSGPIRSNDLFYGLPPNSGNDWIDFNKIAIPQADEQQRLLANIIIQSNLHRKPLPRFWYLPRDLKAAIVMTGDDHDNNGTVGRFEQYQTLAPNTLQDVHNWTAIRGTSYVYPTTMIPNTTAAALEAKGFEIALHASTGCANYTLSSITNDLNSEVNSFKETLPGVALPVTNRTHCLPWSDWASQAKAEAQIGIRLDVNYYYWPDTWVQNRPGMFTGSGIPMRFADSDGSLIDCYQAPTQMTDESGIGVGTFTDALLDKALGPEGYYGVFVANMHTDTANHIGSNAIIASALARQVPVISAKQMLTWLDGRNNSYFGGMTWNSSVLNFSATAYSGSNNLRAMLPFASQDGQLVTITMNSSPIPFTVQTIKGIEYAFFDVAPGTNAYAAAYSNDNTPPVITNITAVTNTNGTATITWTTDELTDSKIDYGTTSGNLNLNVADANLVTDHSITLTGLAPVTTYYFRVTSKDILLNSATSPLPADQPLTFSMPAFPCVNDITLADFNQGSATNTQVVAEADGDVVLLPLLNQDFSGDVLPPGWSSELYNPSGSIAMSSGSVTINGGHIFSGNTYGPGSMIDFVATFNPGAFQSVGFSIDQAFSTGPWVMLGQAGADGNVYARTSDGLSINIGPNLFGVPHRYLIKWNADNFEFYIDGNTSPAATLNFTVASNMYLQVSDFSHTDGAISLDRLRVIPYSTSGTFTSRIFDAGTAKPWGAMIWNSNLPAGTGLTMSVRTGNTPVPDETWSGFVPVAASGTPVGSSSQYIQYRAEMTTADTRYTPVLRDVVIECSSQPLVDSHPSPVTLCSDNVVTFTSTAGGFPVPTVQWQVSSNGTEWDDIIDATNTTLTFTASMADNNKQYRAVWTNSVAVVNSDITILTVKPIPAAPVVTVVNNCGNSELIASGYTGTLLWSNGATTPSITVTDVAGYTITQTVDGCISSNGSGTSAPKVIPGAPTVTVVNNCGNSELTASGYTGTLLWSNGATTASITVTDAAGYTVTQTVDGCTSPNGSGTSAPKLIPGAPTVTVVNNCGNSELTASDYTGTLLWSNGATTPSITVTDAAAYTVTQTVDGCTSPNGSGTSAPKLIPGAPTVTVVNNCGSSELIASGYTGTLLWSNGATTPSITVTDAAAYTVTQTVDGCTSANGSGTSAPKLIPGAPTVAVLDNCGNSVLTASGYTGTLLWSNMATAPAITVTTAGTYTVTQTVDGCISVPGSAAASPVVVPAVPVITTVDNCGNSLLTASNYTGTLLWNTGETSPTITVSAAGTYTVTQTMNGCTSPRIETRGGKATPKPLPVSPAISVVNNCGNSVLTASKYTGALLWSTGASSPSIAVVTEGSYSATQTGTNGCISSPATGIAVPKTIPAAPIVTADGPTTFCQGGSVTLISNEATGNRWNTEATTQSISVNVPGSYKITYTAPNGCISPASAPALVTVKAITASTTNATTCSGQLPYVWNGNNYNATGVYDVTLMNAAGCDSIATLNLTVNTTPEPPVITAGGPLTFCQGSFVTLTSNKTTGNIWSTGATTQSIIVTTSGDYSVTYTAPNGCTSVASVPIAVTVNVPSVSTTNATVCSSQLPYIWNENNYNESGTYNVIFTNGAGCDSVAILLLNVIASTSSTENITRCSNQLPYIWNDVPYSIPGTYTLTGFTNAAGCDSTATLVLTVNAVTSSTENITRCSNQLPYIWNGTPYSLPGTYTLTGFTNVAGCDSTATLVLTVNATTSSTENVTVCSNELPYNWNGNNFNVAGIYSMMLVNAAGCDSIATLNLTINTAPTAGITNITGATILTCTTPSISVTATGGVSYSWSDGTDIVSTAEALVIAAPGTYTVTVTAANNCTATASITIGQDITAPTITGTTPGSRCSTGEVLLAATSSSGTINWYDAATGGLPIGTGASFTTPSISVTTSYWIDATGDNGCITPARTEVVATVSDNLPVSVTIISSAVDNTICEGTSVIFTATPINGGTIPSYQWLLNGAPAGTDQDTYTTTTLADGDIVTVVLTSSATPCATDNPATSNGIVTTVNVNLPVSVTIASSATDNTICEGTSVTFTATPINGGTTPSYQWLLNGTPVGTDQDTYTTTELTDGDEVTVVLTSNATPCATGNPATSNAITTTVNANLPVSVTIVSSATDNTICEGTSVTFTATSVNGGTTPSYQWLLNGIPVGTDQDTYTTTELADGDEVTVVLTSSATPCATGSPATSNSITTTVNANLPVSVTIASSDADNTICEGTSVTFTATPVNGGATPSYQWLLNGIPVGTDQDTYTTTELADDDEITVVLTSNATPCATGNPATSNAITTTVSANLPVSVTIASSAADNTICEGTSVTFTATPVNGGTTPVYQWYVNGNLAEDADQDTYTTTTLADGDIVTVVLTSNATPCATGSPATSNGITTTVNVNLPVSVTITSSDADNTICEGTSVTFTATPINGGATPSYQWLLNGIPVGTDQDTYTTTELADGDEITVVLTSNATPCATGNPATSNAITTTVNINLPVSVTITSNDADNTICEGTSVTFTATPVNGGATPSYQWLLNGTPVGTDQDTYTTTGLVNGDEVTVVLTSNATPCATGNPATSNGIVTTVNVNLPVSVTIVSSATDNTICEGTSVTFTATPVNGGVTPSYQWLLNGNPVGSDQDTYTTIELTSGDEVTVVLTSSATPCATGNPATSNAITTTVSVNLPVSVTIGSSAADNTICEGTSVTFTATPVNGGTTPSYQWLLNGNPVGSDQDTYTTTELTSGDEVTVVLTSNATPCATGNPATSNAITTTVNVNLPVSVTIASSDADNTICDGTSVTFTATPVNGGATPSYQWLLNGTPVGTDQDTYITTTLADGDEVTVVLTSNATPCATGSPATSNAIATTVNANLPVSVTITSSATDNTICEGTSVIFTATPVNGGTTPVYQWYVNGNLVEGADQDTYTTTTLANGDIVTVVLTSSATPCATGSPATSNAITTTVNENLPVSVTIASSDADNTICEGTSVTFTAAPVNGGTTPSYQWLLNGTPVGTDQDTYTTTTLADGDEITVVLTSNATPCATGNPATSNAITMTVSVNLPVSVTITSSAVDNTICEGTSVTFTAMPANGGATPSYQWLLNGNPVGTDQDTYTTTTLADGHEVVVVLTSSATPCATGSPTTSNAIATTVNANLPVSVAITSNDADNTICEGTSVTFTATPVNGGATPSYQWLLNGIPVGTDQDTYTTTELTNGDEVTVVLISNATPCATGNPATSNAITTTVNVNLPVSVTIESSATDNTICEGTSVTFTATPVNGGITPSYQWLLNGTPVGTDQDTYTTAGLADGDEITVVLTSNATACTTGNPATSNAITTTVNTNLPVSVTIASSDADNAICEGTSVTFTATPVNGGATPSYQWLLNGNPAGADQDTYTTTTLADGDIVTVVLTSSATPCATGNPATSNAITTTVNVNLPVNVTITSSAVDNTICEGTSVTFTATPVNGGTTPAYQWYVNGDLVEGADQDTYTTTELVNGDEVTVVLTSNATACATGNPATSNAITTTVNANLPVNVTITSSDADNTICEGTSVTFTATPVNGGTTPVYQWYVNGDLVEGADQDTYTTTELVNGDEVTVVLTSNATACATGNPATSNAITTTVNANLPVNVTIASSDADNTICEGTSVTFTATPVNGGTTPSYQWLLNGSPVSTDQDTYTTTELADGDEVTVVLTSNATACATGSPATSNAITTTVNVNLPVSVTIASSDADNTICAGSSVTFTATPVNGGATPSYQWLLNGNPAGTDQDTYTTTGLISGDVVTVVLTSNATACATGSPAASNAIATTVNALTAITVQPLGGAICSGSSINLSVTATGTNLHYQWMRNGDNIGTDANTYTANSGGIYTVVVTGDCGEITSAEAEVAINTTPPPPTIIAGGPTTFCQGETVTLTSSETIGNTWSTTETTQSIVVNTSGSYTVTYTAPNGCSATSVPTVVTVNPLPALVTNNSMYVMDSDFEFNFDAESTIPGTEISWVRLESGIETEAPSSGTGSIAGHVLSNPLSNDYIDVTYQYTLLVSATGCTRTENVVVRVNSVPQRVTAGTPKPNTLTRIFEATLTVTAMPNTTTDYFNLVIKSKEDGPVTMRVHDLYGTIVERREKIAPGTTLRIGQGWAAGIYFVEVLQGNNRKVVKLIKTN